MCCNSFPGARAQLLKRFGKRRTLRLWKVVTENGTALNVPTWQYRPGVNISSFKRQYRRSSPTGIHVCVKKEKGYGKRTCYRTVAVVCHRDDFVRSDFHQAVFTKVTILRKDWAAAGLPAIKRAKR